MLKTDLHSSVVLFEVISIIKLLGPASHLHSSVVLFEATHLL